MRVAIQALLALSCALTVTVSGASNEEAMAGSLGPDSSSLFATLYESKVALLCTSIVAMMACLRFWVPSAMLQQRRVARRRSSAHEAPVLPPPQHGEAVARAYEARLDHEKAASSYSSVAVQSREQADALGGQRRFREAAEAYVKSAAMYAAAGEQARAHVRAILPTLVAFGELEQAPFAGRVADHAEMGNYNERYAMHLGAADCYDMMAAEHAADGHHEEARMMSQAAAGQYEASAACAQACHRRDQAAGAYGCAAERYAMIGDLNKVRLMREAESKLHNDQITDRFVQAIVQASFFPFAMC